MEKVLFVAEVVTEEVRGTVAVGTRELVTVEIVKVVVEDPIVVLLLGSAVALGTFARDNSIVLDAKLKLPL
jgi:hypothetical protein